MLSNAELQAAGGDTDAAARIPYYKAAVERHNTTPYSEDDWDEIASIASAQVEDDMIERQRTDPNPTDIEILMGTFIEALEPQVRDAVYTMVSKGYTTNSSGFYGEGSQGIDGYFKIDPVTQQKLEQMGVFVSTTKRGYTHINLLPERPDMEEIKQKWAAIAVVIPKLPTPAAPSQYSETFGKAYISDIHLKRVLLGNRLARGLVDDSNVHELLAQYEALCDQEAAESNNKKPLDK